MTLPFVSVTDLGILLGQDLSSSELATIAIDSSCEMIRSYLGQHLNWVEDDVVTMGGTGGKALLLPELPIVSISEILVDETVEEDFVYVVKAGLVYRGNGTIWPRGVANITVTYSHGYAFDEDDVEDDPDDDTPKPERMPADIRRVALALSQRIFVSAGTVVGALKSESISPDSYTYTLADTASSAAASTVIAPEEMFVLDFYRFAGVA